MKKSITENRLMTIEEVMSVFVYRPYNDELKFMIDSGERIHIKGDTWLVILDHNTGEFYFEGTISRYYEVDTITSIRDAFGDIYSVFNVNYDSIPVDTWMTIEKEEYDPGETDYHRKYKDDEEAKKRMLEYKKEYYWKHREEISKRQKAYYQNKKKGFA